MASVPELAKQVRARVRLRALANAARERHADANALADSQRFAGAVYIAGYAVEASLEYACCRAKGLTDADEVGLEEVKRLMADARRQRLMANDGPHPLVGWARYLQHLRTADARLPQTESARLHATVRHAETVWRHWRPELRYLPTTASAEQWQETQKAVAWFLRLLAIPRPR